MAERVTFHFEGGLANDHQLNFYEAARFQYAAARLVVKLAQFRSTGRFVQKITNNSNQDIVLETQSTGSFDISILIPGLVIAYEAFVNTSVSSMISYVIERILPKASGDNVVDILNSQRAIVEAVGRISEGNAEQMNRALEIIRDDQIIKENLNAANREILERRIAELERDRDMHKASAELAKIDSAREQKLISMSAPLVSEMATALRRSANTLEIKSQSGTSRTRNIVFLNDKMAEEIEISVVDREITAILGDIIQYNKETGWGKARLQISETPLSFSVPSDIKGRLQQRLLTAMGRDKVYLQTYVVRDKQAVPTRLIVVGILPTPEA